MKYVLMALVLVATLFTSAAFAASTQTAQAGKYTVEFAPQPAPPIVGKNQVTFTVKDGDKPVTGAGVSLHVDMVGMSMPADVTVSPGTKDGQYVATVNFSMAGQWTLAAAVQGMAGMAMDGDGTATFTVMAGGAMAPSAPTHPATPASLPWPLIIGGVAVVGIVVVIVMVRGRSKQTPGV